MLMQTYMRLSSASPSGHQPMLACLVWGDESRIYQFQKWLPLSLVEAQYLEGCAAGLTWCSLAIWSSNRASGCLAAENRSALQGQPVTNYFNIDKLIYTVYVSIFPSINQYQCIHIQNSVQETSQVELFSRPGDVSPVTMAPLASLLRAPSSCCNSSLLVPAGSGMALIFSNQRFGVQAHKVMPMYSWLYSTEKGRSGQVVMLKGVWCFWSKTTYVFQHDPE